MVRGGGGAETQKNGMWRPSAASFWVLFWVRRFPFDKFFLPLYPSWEDKRSQELNIRRLEISSDPCPKPLQVLKPTLV